tara:strand:- start:1070 stop:1780 length:711 start_codon:yes stop_codon:yes gene_type:complete
MNIIIYYINLDRRNDRNEKIIKELELITDIPIKRISAIDKNELNRNKLIEEKYITDKTSLRLGQIACILSHMKVWEEFLNSNYDYCIILEDDVKINKKYFNEHFYNILNELNNINFDWLYLGRNNLQFKNFYKGKMINKYFYIPQAYGYGTHSYILSRDGAKLKFDYYNTLKNNTFFTNHPLDFLESNKYLIKHFLNKEIKILSILPIKDYNSDKIIEKFSDEFLFYPINVNDSDT